MSLACLARAPKRRAPRDRGGGPDRGWVVKVPAPRQAPPSPDILDRLRAVHRRSVILSILATKTGQFYESALLDIEEPDVALVAHAERALVGVFETATRLISQMCADVLCLALEGDEAGAVARVGEIVDWMPGVFRAMAQEVEHQLDTLKAGLGDHAGPTAMSRVHRLRHLVVTMLTDLHALRSELDPEG